MTECYADPGEPEAAPAPPLTQHGPRAACVLCGKPTEYPASLPGLTMCPVCEWQEAQRTACSG
ncbi:hypothetical protein G3I60_25205 [Streptomyces sp. SID13666]|uniref:hypothetical protein n=1 Tax=Streptomyces TaxID=1883 RepID=UPI001106C460|nr:MULTISPECIES: hypothetical protein [Streptomyces]MCZ4102042.1 hypothetical protein [Streptomyces sp. H39-C1]NEA57357.1 hypothetical protein [Streptomyces sp. SID13666]QNA75909.1 hypothetical protein C8250_032055 [Streptomyces sp. So13.3]